MLKMRDVEALAGEAARNVLNLPIEGVLAHSDGDWDGRENLSVIVIVRHSDRGRLGGDALLDLSLAVQQALEARGDERTAHVTYATATDIEAQDPDDEAAQA